MDVDQFKTSASDVAQKVQTQGKEFADKLTADLADKYSAASKAAEYAAKGFWGKLVTNVTANPKIALSAAISAGMVVLTALYPPFFFIAAGVAVVAPFVVNSMSSTR